MTEERGRLLHLTRYYQSLDPMNGFASTNVYENLLESGWTGETRFHFVEDKETWLVNTPSLRDDIFDQEDFENFDVDLIVLEGGVKPTGLLDDWRVPADMLIDFVESGGVVVALDVDTGRLRAVDDRADTRFFGARVETEGTVPYISEGIGSVFDLDPADMLVSPWLRDAYQGITSLHVRAAVPVGALGDIAISSSARARRLRDDVFQPGMGPFPFGTVLRHGKGFAASVFAHMTTDTITDVHPDNARWVTSLIHIVTAEAARRRRLSEMSLTNRPSGLVEETGIGATDRVTSELQRLHPLIRSAAGTLYADGHFGSAILEAYKALELRVRQITDLDESGRGMMAKVFDQNDPVLRLNNLKTRSDRDEQEGFKLIYMGSIQGIRNPLAHESDFRDDPDLTLEHLALASLLMRRLDDARTVG